MALILLACPAANSCTPSHSAITIVMMFGLYCLRSQWYSAMRNRSWETQLTAMLCTERNSVCRLACLTTLKSSSTRVINLLHLTAFVSTSGSSALAPLNPVAQWCAMHFDAFCLAFPSFPTRWPCIKQDLVLPTTCRRPSWGWRPCALGIFHQRTIHISLGSQKWLSKSPDRKLGHFCTRISRIATFRWPPCGENPKSPYGLFNGYIIYLLYPHKMLVYRYTVVYP